MITMEGLCSECKQKISISIGQYVVDSELVWSQSYCCEFCNNCIEFDDSGLPPENIRNAIIKSQGSWELILQEEDIKKIKPKLIKMYRKEFNWSLQKCIKSIEILSDVIYHGTKTENEWFYDVLDKYGIAVEIRPHPHIT